MFNSYKEMLSELINIRSTQIVANSNKDIYMEALECIFNQAVFDVVWYINDETQLECITKNVEASIIKFLDAGKKLSIYVYKRYPDGRLASFLKRIVNSEKYKQNFNYYKSGRISTEGKEIDFLVFDNEGYRYSFEPNKCRAIFCANDVEFCNKLLKSLK